MNEEQRQKERSPKAKLLYVKQHKTNRIHAHGLLGSLSSLEEIGQLALGLWEYQGVQENLQKHQYVKKTTTTDQMLRRNVSEDSFDPRWVTQQQMGVTMKA